MLHENRYGTDNVITYVNETRRRERNGLQYNLKSINKVALSSRNMCKIRFSESMLLLIALILQVALLTLISGYQIHKSHWQPILVRKCHTIPRYYFTSRLERKCRNHLHSLLLLSSDDWSSFQAMDDDDEIVFGKVLDKQDYAVENDSQFEKEAVGALRSAPTIERNADAISVPAGKTSSIHYCCVSLRSCDLPNKLYHTIQVRNWSFRKKQY